MNLFDKNPEEPIEIILQRRKKAFEEFLLEEGCGDCKIIMHCKRNEFEAEWCPKFARFYNEKYEVEVK